MIRNMQPQDSEAVLEIYMLGIRTGQATFETNIPSWQEWDKKHHSFCRLVYVADKTIAGWAALSPVSARSCYKGVAEVSIYIHPDFQQKGIGSQLLVRLIDESEDNNIWTLQSAVFPENKATIRLHQKNNFRKIGIRKKIAKLAGVWRDTILFERRSSKTELN